MFLLLASPSLNAQTGATLQGRVFDASGAVIPAAAVRVRSESTGFDESAFTDTGGALHVTAIPAGSRGRVSPPARAVRPGRFNSL